MAIDRLVQEALGHQQREVDGGGVLAVVEQALGDVERGDVVVLGLFGQGENEFVAGAALGLGGLAAKASAWLARRRKREIVSFCAYTTRSTLCR